MASVVRAQAGPPSPQAASSKPPLAEFKDISELKLDDLLSLTVSIAAGRVQRVEEAPSIVSVITAEDIRRLGATHLDQVLKLVPGFEVLLDANGQTQIVVRGIGTSSVSENVLVLFNGRRLNEQITGGATQFNQRFSLAGIKQIEIIRGPGSSLFGANAFVGVINLVPFSAASFDGIEAGARLESFGTAGAHVLAGRTLGRLSLFGTLEHSSSTGPRKLIGADAQTLGDRYAPAGQQPASLAPALSRDAYRSTDASARLEYGGLTIASRLHNGVEDGGYIGLLQSLGTYNVQRGRQWFADATQRIVAGANGGLSLHFGFTNSQINYARNGTPPGYTRTTPDGRVITFPTGVEVTYAFNSRRYDQRIVADYLLGEHQLTAGVSLEQEVTFNEYTNGNFNVFTGAPLPTLQPQPFSIVPHSSRRMVSGYVQDTWNVVPSVGITAGVRHDQYSDFGGTTNPRAAIVWRLPNSLYVKALYGRAFRAPSFLELYYLVPGSVSGNPLLKPSHIATSEVALGYSRGNLRVSGNLFANNIETFISPTRPLLITNIVGANLTYINLDKLRVRGLELDVRRSFGIHRDVFANYTYQSPTVPATGARLPDVPSHLANFGGTTALGPYLSITPAIIYRSSRPRDARDFRVDPQSESFLRLGLKSAVAGYTVLNLNTQLRNVFDLLELNVVANNLLDTQYVDPSGLNGVPGDFPATGRSFGLKGTYKF